MGHVHILRDFASPSEGFARTLRIYVPDGYEAGGSQRLPVLYMHDGQNVFAHPESACWDTWCANLTLEALTRARALEPWLVVAVDSGLGRMEDYSPWDEPRAGIRGRGAAYARFLVEHLKPWVDGTFRTRPGPEWTAVMGSSLGGLMSLYLGHAHPGVFGRVGALSPTVMWSGRKLFDTWAPRNGHRQRIYMDAGLEEHFQAPTMSLAYGEATRDFYLHLRRLGYCESEVRCVLEQGGVHHERDWGRRLPLALRWLLA
jgi:predicted alpha/beta superfamily hydrolase